MRSRFTFPGDEILDNAHTLKLSLIRKPDGSVALMHGSVGDLFARHETETAMNYIFLNNDNIQNLCNDDWNGIIVCEDAAMAKKVADWIWRKRHVRSEVAKIGESYPGETLEQQYEASLPTGANCVMNIVDFEGGEPIAVVMTLKKGMWLYAPRYDLVPGSYLLEISLADALHRPRLFSFLPFVKKHEFRPHSEILLHLACADIVLAEHADSGERNVLFGLDCVKQIEKKRDELQVDAVKARVVKFILDGTMQDELEKVAAMVLMTKGEYEGQDDD